jgi:hypothetical protein
MLFAGISRPFPERVGHVVVPRRHMTIAIPSHLSADLRPTASTHRPVVKPLAADRYEIRFTASGATS